MTKQSASQTRDATKRLRDVRGWGRAGSLLLALAVWVSASTAMAAEIVEVRVGRHANFTRVVFELDRAAGYRIERTESSSGVTELVVSVEATSIPRHIGSSKSLITQVEVAPVGGRSVARIALARDGLKLKEMILASPPRIVLDVLSDTPITPAPKVAKTPVKAAPKPIAKPAPAPVVKEPAPAPKMAVVPPRPAPTQVVEKPEVTAEPAIDSRKTFDSGQAMPDDSASGEDEWTANAANTVPAPDRDGSDAAAGTANQWDDSGASDAVDRANALIDRDPALAPTQTAQTPSTPSEASPTAKPDARPMVAKTETDEGGGWMAIALAAVGVVVLLLGGAMILRNRRAGADFSDDEDEDSDFDGMSGENPFSEAETDAGQMNLGKTEDATMSPVDGDTTIVSSPQDSEEKKSESVVFDSEEEAMEVISRDAVNESLGMPPEMGALPAEFQQMIRDMNSRVQALEGRIDELVDARDRLERQVAAQTEELRVQRAAIARTQRAVRNLARPEGEDQEATEPALRDPKQPGSGE
jgi:hypothetical protein